MSRRYPDGSIIQSDAVWDEDDYGDYKLYFPVLGVVLNVYPPDHPSNRSAQDDDNFRGYFWEADVAIVNDGKESNTPPLRNVVIAPGGPSGVDDFTQNLPRPSTMQVDGSKFQGSLVGIDLDKLDGDRCLVQFIGGKYNNPVMTSWMPHPANRKDSSTGGHTSSTLDQGSPTLYRRGGTRVSITPEGSVFVDTNEANSKLSGSPSGYSRETLPGGGDIQIDLKSGSSFEVNCNPQVNVSSQEPSVLQANPPPADVGTQEREDTASSIFIDKDHIRAIAGEVVHIISRNNNIVLTPFSDIFFGSEESEENFVLGQQWKTLMTNLWEAFLNHTHSTGTGPSGPPLAPEGTTGGTVQGLIDGIDDVLSDYIFGSKEPPPEELTDKEDEEGEDA